MQTIRQHLTSSLGRGSGLCCLLLLPVALAIYVLLEQANRNSMVMADTTRSHKVVSRALAYMRLLKAARPDLARARPSGGFAYAQGDAQEAACNESLSVCVSHELESYSLGARLDVFCYNYCPLK